MLELRIGLKISVWTGPDRTEGWSGPVRSGRPDRWTDMLSYILNPQTPKPKARPGAGWNRTLVKTIFHFSLFIIFSFSSIIYYLISHL